MTEPFVTGVGAILSADIAVPDHEREVQPPVWLIHLPVGDLAESLRRVAAEGGTIIKTHRDEEGRASLAVARDPVGVSFALSAA